MVAEILKLYPAMPYSPVILTCRMRMRWRSQLLADAETCTHSVPDTLAFSVQAAKLDELWSAMFNPDSAMTQRRA